MHTGFMGRNREVVIYDRRWVNSGIRISVWEMVVLVMVMGLVFGLGRWGWESKQVEAREIKVGYYQEFVENYLESYLESEGCYPTGLDQVCEDSKGLWSREELCEQIEGLEPAYIRMACDRYRWK